MPKLFWATIFVAAIGAAGGAIAKVAELTFSTSMFVFGGAILSSAVIATAENDGPGGPIDLDGTEVSGYSRYVSWAGKAVLISIAGLSAFILVFRLIAPLFHNT